MIMNNENNNFNLKDYKMKNFNITHDDKTL